LHDNLDVDSTSTPLSATSSLAESKDSLL